MRENFGRVFASIFPMYYTDRDDMATEICEKFLGQFYTAEGKWHFGVIFSDIFIFFPFLFLILSRGHFGTWIDVLFLDHNKLIPKELDKIVIELLIETSFDKNPEPPLYSPEAVTKLLEHLASSWNLTVVDLLYNSR